MPETVTAPRILVVDDDPVVSRLLGQSLSQKGFTCQVCSSGEEALARLAHEAFDVVISDLRMPGISGLELLERAHTKYPRTAFLMTTGEDDIRVGIAAMKKGAEDYLVKPFLLDGVLASVRRALEKKRLELELENYRHNLERMVRERTRQLRTAMKRIELTYDETLEALGAALDLRDNQTAGHSRRVTNYCLEMARAIGSKSEALDHIARGAYLHDIGKIGIPDAILLKPGKLSEKEMATMQTHARIGYDLVNRIAFLAPAAEIVLTHQERFDGTGYPQGLTGKQIPMGGRIFAVADTLDAMTSDRPYRRARPFEAARAEIKRQSGRQFDPQVVLVFLAIEEHTWEKVRH
jgi:response regulator RpfG family c-di-GMP phosphodiesterase